MKIFASLAAIAVALAVAAPASASAPLLQIDISPLTGALNLGTNIYVNDHAVGLSALNAVGQPASAATGNEVGSGITYDQGVMNLAFDFAYGSAFGFTDLAGDFSVLHIHGPNTVNFPAANTGAGVVQGLAGFHTASGPRSGRVTGNITLNATDQTRLFNNELYINIHSGFASGGEIRGQLVVIPEPASALFALLAAPLFLRRRR